MVSLVLKFINNLRKQSDSFDVKTVEPRALLNYVDPHFIGMQDPGRDSLHTANWKKLLHTARVTLDIQIRQGVPTTLSTVSSEDQLMINNKGFLGLKLDHLSWNADGKKNTKNTPWDCKRAQEGPYGETHSYAGP